MFNLADYEPVEVRLEKFIKDYPDFRISTELEVVETSRYIVKAYLFKTSQDSIAWATGYAEETVSTRGVNQTSALENCETSAIGRALANAGYAPKGKRPSREEMSKVAPNHPALKVVKQEVKPAPQDIKEGDTDYWTTPIGSSVKTTLAPVTLESAMATVTEILGTAEAEHKYIKQTGGKGQYGHVKITIKPLEPWPEGEKIPKHIKRYDDFEFINSIKGGAIPGEFIPAVEKGVHEAMDRGIVAGFRLVNISCELTYGSYHDVDSSEIAYKIAASQAFQEAARRAKPVILEPIMKLEVIAPEKYMGDVNGSIASKRGQVEGSEPRGQAIAIHAKVPLSEMFGYTTALRSMTSGQGSAMMEFDHYEVVPANVEKEIAEKRKV